MKIRKAGNGWECAHFVRRRFKEYKDSRLYKERFLAAMAALNSADPADNPCCAIRDKLDEFIHDSLKGINRRTPCDEKTAARHRRRLLRFDAAFHSKPLDAITRQEVENWVRRRLKHPGRSGKVTADTVEADLVPLRAFARWAQGKDLAPAALPLQTFGRLRSKGKVKGNRRPAEIMGMGEVLEVIARIGGVRPDVELVLTGMVLFILRPASVWRLRRGDVRLPVAGTAGGLFVREIKGHPARTLPIPSGSRHEAWVRRCLSMGAEDARPDSPLLICTDGRNSRNPGGWTTDTLDRAVAAVCGALGFDFRFTLYLIRHSTIAWLQDRSDMTLANVAAGAGHASVVTQAHYDHTTARQARKAFAAINTLMDNFKPAAGG